MFDLGDEFTIESYRIPWLIWIQILIFFLLIFLLYCFSAVTSDLSHNNSSSSSSSSSSSILASASTSSYLNKVILKHNSTATVTNRLQHNQIGESRSIKGERATSTTSTRIVREENAVTEGFSTSTIIEFHPCNYFRLAKLAFLKCFGFDSTSESSSSSKPKKDR